MSWSNSVARGRDDGQEGFLEYRREDPHGHADEPGVWVHMGEACHEIRDVDERGTHT